MKRFFPLFIVALVLLIASFALNAIPYPVICTTHGCIMSTSASSQQAHENAFATRSHSTPASYETVLTTLTRKHLLSFQPSAAKISQQQAQQYREQVLHLTDVSHVTQLGYSTFTSYDEAVTIPFLQQEALMQEKNIQHVDQLYQELSANRWIVVLNWKYRWDENQGRVVAK